MSEFIEPDPSGEITLIPRRALVIGGAIVGLLAYNGLLDDTLRAGTHAAESTAHFVESLNDPVPSAPDSAIDSSQAAGTAASQDAIETVVQPVVTTLVEAIPPVIETAQNYDGWALAVNYKDIINSLDRSPEQKAYLIRMVEAVYGAMASGAILNPRMLTTQIINETGWGNDGISGPDEGNNLVGIKAGKGDCVIQAAGSEYENGVEVFYDDLGFKCYPTPEDSIIDYAGMLQRLRWYEDALNCRHDDELYVRGLVDYRDPNTCELISPQGEKGVKSYATDPNYVSANLALRDELRLAEIFPLVSEL